MHHHLRVDHATDMVIPFVQKAVPCLSLCLSSLSLNIEIEHFCSLKSGWTECAAKAEPVVDCLQSAACLDSNLRHVFIFGAWVIEQ